MMPDGIGDVRSRISEIEQRFGIERVGSLPGVSSTTGVASFESALVGALGANTAVPATLGAAAPAGVVNTQPLTLDTLLHNIGGLTANGKPAELQKYGNGKIPSVALTSIGQGNHKLWDPAARAWNVMKAAAKADGIDLSVTDSYRSYEAQVDVANRKGLYSQGGLAAKPGTSDHGWGMAVDVNTNEPGAVEWLRANASRFGFIEDTPREPWHWVFEPQSVSH